MSNMSNMSRAAHLALTMRQGASWRRLLELLRQLGVAGNEMRPASTPCKCLPTKPCCRRLLAVLRRRFLEAGGAIFEQHTFKAARVFDDGVTIQLLPSAVGAAAVELADVNRPMALQHDHTVTPSSGSGGDGGSSSNGGSQRRRELTARLLVDCMVS